ncbi:unnamed protein product [Protopolystoma xenopodis]|uniref:Uncharacterized protein n=1 Tax=Protopolystoma xenopodis TaxID=117903 RepID=A0A3S5B7Q5_9PLAT|nr:unnamed protein product [Protopolystoma xenopodis]
MMSNHYYDGAITNESVRNVDILIRKDYPSPDSCAPPVDMLIRHNKIHQLSCHLADQDSSDSPHPKPLHLNPGQLPQCPFTGKSTSFSFTKNPLPPPRSTSTREAGAISTEGLGDLVEGIENSLESLYEAVDEMAHLRHQLESTGEIKAVNGLMQWLYQSY